MYAEKFCSESTSLESLFSCNAVHRSALNSRSAAWVARLCLLLGAARGAGGAEGAEEGWEGTSGGSPESSPLSTPSPKFKSARDGPVATWTDGGTTHLPLGAELGFRSGLHIGLEIWVRKATALMGESQSQNKGFRKFEGLELRFVVLCDLALACVLLVPVPRAFDVLKLFCGNKSREV